MTRFRHDLILRMTKLLDAVLVTIPFAMCWYLYYAKRVASPYYAMGHKRSVRQSSYISNSVILTSYCDLNCFGQITSKRSPAPSVTKQFHHKITYPLSYNGLRRLGDLGIVYINFTIPACGL